LNELAILAEQYLDAHANSNKDVLKKSVEFGRQGIGKMKGVKGKMIVMQD